MPRPSLLRLHPSASRAEVWLGAALLALCVALTPWWGAEGPLERMLLQAALPPTLSAPDVTALTIEDADLDRLGPWPWPRDRHAALIDRLVESGARTIVYLVPLSGPDPTSRGLADLRTLRGLLGPVPEQAEGLAGALSQALTRAERTLDTDTRLADSLRRADRVLLLCEPASGAAGLGPRPPPAAWRLDGAGMALPTTACRPPLPPLGEAALAVGGVALDDSTFGPWTLQAFAPAGSQVAPSLPLAALWHAQGVTRAPIAKPSAWGGAIVSVGDAPVRVDGRGAVRLLGAPTRGADGVAVLPWARGMADRTAMAALRGQIVVVGPAQAGALGPVAAPAVAQAVVALGQGRTFVELVPNRPLALVLFALEAIYLIVLMPWLATPWAVGMSVGLACLLLSAEWVLLRQHALWLPLVQPAALMGAAALVWALCRWRLASASVPEATLEAQRLRGLALQGRGQFEAAYRQFKALPAAPATLECLLGLAQQCEQQGEVALARRVYQHLLRRDRTHAQAQAGYRRTRGATGAPAAAGAAPVPEASQVPPAAVTALGRYQIEQALGQGAMGVVYRGRDPTIGRVVAIKTLALSQEFEGEGLVQARERFFREAETAGRLQHPHIVTIFDAGEAQGLAYIAMEFLQGHDLSTATQPGTLMPVAQVLSIAARVAQALDYAHAHQVVHRDIKPANIMFDAATDMVKVTDFGIARITDSNRTRTGLVLGTPSFMAPEQLAGRRVDGRCDLYALGVTLFQWLTGSLPLRGNSMGALMQQIAHAVPPDVRTLRPELPADVAALVACALQKSPAERFQTGLQMAEALRRALDHLPDALGHRDVERVVYDAPRDATGQDMAQLQGTVVELSSPRGVDSGRPAGAA